MEQAVLKQLDEDCQTERKVQQGIETAEQKLGLTHSRMLWAFLAFRAV